jgi:hypothetical protein
LDKAVLALPVDLDGRDFRGDLNIRVDAHGGWYYNQSPVDRKDMVCLFASMLMRDSLGGYWLVTPTEVGRIEVDDAPLLAVELIVRCKGGDQQIGFRTNTDQIITVSARTPLIVKPSPITQEMTPYVVNDKGVEAKLTRSVYYELVEVSEQQCCQEKPSNHDILGVQSCGAFFPLGAIFNTDA